MKKFILRLVGITFILFIVYCLFIYFAKYSEGIRAGELIKFSHKGVVVKTWEGEISQGVSEGQLFRFSVERSEKQVIDDYLANKRSNLPPAMLRDLMLLTFQNI